MVCQGEYGAGGQQETAPGRFWVSGKAPVGREPRGALEDWVTPGRDSRFADDVVSYWHTLPDREMSHRRQPSYPSLGASQNKEKNAVVEDS